MAIDLFSQSDARCFAMIRRVSVSINPAGAQLRLRIEFKGEQPPPNWLRQLRISLCHDDREQVREFTPRWPDEFGDSQIEVPLEQAHANDWQTVFPPHTAPLLPIAFVVLLRSTDWLRYENATSLDAFRRRQPTSHSILED